MRRPAYESVNSSSLRWDDIDFENLESRVTESIWHQVLGVCKTEASARPVPMDGYMAEDLLRWRKNCALSHGVRLGLCEPGHARQAALLAGQSLEAIYQASGKEGWH